MDTNTTPLAEINLQPNRMQDYSAYVPVRLGKLTVDAFVDSRNTFTNVISPQTMTALGIETSQLEPIPQLSVSTSTAGKKMKILGQAHRLELQIRATPGQVLHSPPGAAGTGPSVEPLMAIPATGWDRPDSFTGRITDTRERGPDALPCHTRAPPSLQSAPEVCTLHVATPSAGRQQYDPHGPSTKVRSD